MTQAWQVSDVRLCLYKVVHFPLGFLYIHRSIRNDRHRTFGSLRIDRC